MDTGKPRCLTAPRAPAGAPATLDFLGQILPMYPLNTTDPSANGVSFMQFWLLEFLNVRVIGVIPADGQVLSHNLAKIIPTFLARV